MTVTVGLPAKQTTPQHLVAEDRNQSSLISATGSIYVTIYWTSDDCHGQAILILDLSVGQVILFPYFDH